MADIPFDSIECAHEYISLLRAQVEDVQAGFADDIATSGERGVTRRVDALRLVEYKLTQLGSHLATSARILNDLRALRRLLLAERDSPFRSSRESTVTATVERAR